MATASLATAQSPAKNAKAQLALLRSITARMYHTADLGKDSCIYMRLRTTTEPREGECITSNAELFNGHKALLFNSDFLEEHQDTKNHVRIWPNDQQIMITNSSADALLRTQQVMIEVNRAITEKAEVTKSRTFTDASGKLILSMDLKVNIARMGGQVLQRVEIDLDCSELRRIDLFLPAEHPLRSYTVEYADLRRRRMPKQPPYVKALLAQRRPIKQYKNNSVRDLRTSK